MTRGPAGTSRTSSLCTTTTCWPIWAVRCAGWPTCGNSRARGRSWCEAATFGRMRERADRLAPDTLGVLRDRQAFFRRGGSGQGRDLLDEAGLGPLPATGRGAGPTRPAHLAAPLGPQGHRSARRRSAIGTSPRSGRLPPPQPFGGTPAGTWLDRPFCAGQALSIPGPRGSKPPTVGNSTIRQSRRGAPPDGV